MPIQHSPPARKTRSWARVQAVLTPNPKSPLDGTPAVPQPEEENSVEEEYCDCTEGVPAPVGESQGTGGAPRAQYNEPVSHHSEPSLLALMHKMTLILSNFQTASSSEESRQPAFKSKSFKARDCFDGTQPFEVRSFIQYFQLVFTMTR
ncbi:hypothetical protein O181_100180 [Austropuccinia psidii MF-1]|uniref:Uncharacterized protein n=1 Tax=Austropuccinia psidii MF-1 TaxID=1389203 RepID=A0A9Q3PGL5_9BASI|nr:hypothetical protein [Austropuccinia psidii MF-1]